MVEVLTQVEALQQVEALRQVEALQQAEALLQVEALQQVEVARPTVLVADADLLHSWMCMNLSHPGHLHPRKAHPGRLHWPQVPEKGGSEGKTWRWKGWRC